MKKSIFFRLAILALLGLSLSNPVMAGDLYVNLTSGNNANTGYGTANARASIAKALADAVPGDVIKIFPGNYNLERDNATLVEGQSGWYMAITKNNLTFIGVDANGLEISNPANTLANIYSTNESPNGSWSSQNLITIFADNITFKGLTIMNKISPNKGIEVLGNNFQVFNCRFAPVPLSLFPTGNNYDGDDDITKYGSCVYFNNNNATAARTAVIRNNIFLNSGISFDSFRDNWTVTIEENTFDGNTIWRSAGVDYYYSAIGATTWANQPDFTGSKITINRNNFINTVDGKTLVKIKAGMIGQFTATNNWWGTTDQTAILAKTFGDVKISPWLQEEVSDLYFNITFTKQPRITDDGVNVDFKIAKNTKDISAMQFDYTISRTLNNNNIEVVHYDPNGVALTDQINISKNVIKYDNDSVTYRFVITPKNSDLNKFLHRYVVNAPDDLYKVLTIKFKKSLTNANFRIGETINVQVSNIYASKANGGLFKTMRFGQSEMKNQMISHRFKPTGDINNSGVVDVQDLMLIINHILQIRYLSGSEFCEADLNRDDQVDISDAMLLLQIINGAEIPGIIKSTGNIIMERMNGYQTFKTDKALAVYFTSTEPMLNVTGLENAEVVFNQDRTAMSATFEDYRNCDIDFNGNSTVTAYRVGLENKPLGIEDDLAMAACHPNPSQGSVIITNPLGQSTITIYSLDGQIVYTHDLSETTFTYENHNPGTYFYTIKNADQTSHGKFVIIK